MNFGNDQKIETVNQSTFCLYYGGLINTLYFLIISEIHCYCRLPDL